MDTPSALRIIQPRQRQPRNSDTTPKDKIKWLRFPMNFLTAPLIADLFLLAITAIGRTEVYDGTVGTDHIYPIEIMAFFITLAYIAISLDASGLIRWLALKVLQKGGSNGHLLFFYLYCFFFGLASFIGNDPIVLSGTPFLAYMTRLSDNIRDPKAWIYTQFSVANVASAILVSSNPTNLVLAGAFGIKFIEYTANMIVPVILTAVLYFPFLLYYVFRDKTLVPRKIEMHQPSTDQKAPINPNIPCAGGITEEDKDPNTKEGEALLLEEIMNPYLDKKSAIFSSVVVACTLIAILVLNASSTKEYPAFYVTLPAAVIVFCWDVWYGWKHRHETQRISRGGREEIERRRQEEAERGGDGVKKEGVVDELETPARDDLMDSRFAADLENDDHNDKSANDAENTLDEKGAEQVQRTTEPPKPTGHDLSHTSSSDEIDEKIPQAPKKTTSSRTTLDLYLSDRYRWAQETFPTTTAVLSHLPLPLVPFGLCVFILVQALVTKGWITVFAYGWDHWVHATGTVGAIGGMGFLSVIFCNFAGTNIGTAIFLCRLIQEWVVIREQEGIKITDRTFWATVYSCAIGLNYGAFSTAFSASLAGMLWRNILARKHIHVSAMQFARVNIRLIAFTMIVGCTVLIGEVWIFRGDSKYSGSSGSG